MSMVRSEEQQFIQQSRKKIIHGVDPDDERSDRQIAMFRDDVLDKLKNKANQQQKQVRKSSNTIKKRVRWAGCEKI